MPEPDLSGFQFAHPGRVLIEVLELTGVSPQSGIVIQRNEKHPKIRGIVRAVGPGCLEDIEVGDMVFYKRYAGDAITWDGHEYEVFNEKDIVARLEWEMPQTWEKEPETKPSESEQPK